MPVLELKGELHEIIDAIESEKVLLKILKTAKKVTEEGLRASTPTEITIVQQRLHNKYVVNGTWDKMDEEAREDATHAEIMLYAKEQPDYYLYTVEQTKAHRAKLKQQLTAKIANHANH